MFNLGEYIYMYMYTPFSGFLDLLSVIYSLFCFLVEIETFLYIYKCIYREKNPFSLLLTHTYIYIYQLLLLIT